MTIKTMRKHSLIAFMVGSSFILGGLAFADTAPPTSETTLYFEQGGQHVTQPVNFTITCFGPDDYGGTKLQFQKGKLTDICQSYGCKFPTSGIFGYKGAVTSCDIEGTVNGTPFHVKNFLDSSLSKLDCQPSYEIGTGSRYYQYTPAYLACIDAVHKKYYATGKYLCSTYSIKVATCPAGKRCMTVDGALVEMTDKTDACNNAEFDEEQACLTQAIDVTDAVNTDRSNGTSFDNHCKATVTLQATTTTNTQPTIEASTSTTKVPPAERGFFARILDAIGCFFVRLFGGSCG